MNETAFFKKLVDYMNSRYSGEIRGEMPPYLTGIHHEKLKWHTTSVGCYDCSFVYETVDEEIAIASPPTIAIEDTILDYLTDLDGSNRSKETERIMREILNSENWFKYKPKFPAVIEQLEWGEKIARKITERTEIDVKHYVPEPPWNDSLFYTEFDSTRISDDQKMEEIKKRLDIIDTAYKEFKDYERKHAEELPREQKT